MTEPAPIGRELPRDMQSYALECGGPPGGHGIRPCAKCGAEPRAKGQRWGRQCRAAYEKKRRRGRVFVPREFVRRGTLDERGRVKAARVLKARKRLRRAAGAPARIEDGGSKMAGRAAA